MNELQRVNGQEATVPTLIGGGPMRFAIGGKIRAGIKVLTAVAARERQAQAIFEAGIAEEKSYDDIAAEITRAVPELRHPLMPKNVSYFSVRRVDFAMPELADQILANFGEDRGDGGRRLYRFPVVFPADETLASHPGRPIVLTQSGDTTANVDRERIAQLLSNLIGNALQHGSQTGEIAISVVGTDRDVTSEVHNEGRAIDAEELKAIFERLRRGRQRAVEVEGNLGLGLHIARTIAVAHGGSIDVTSTTDRGTTFVVRLPRTGYPS